jgi:hypothetical protein
MDLAAIVRRQSEVLAVVSPGLLPDVQGPIYRRSDIPERSGAVKVLL